MVNGEIVVVPQDPATLTTESDATSSVLLGTNKREKLTNEPVYMNNIEKPSFHLVPQEQAVCTLESGMRLFSKFYSGFLLYYQRHLLEFISAIYNFVVPIPLDRCGLAFGKRQGILSKGPPFHPFCLWCFLREDGTY